jgi:Na+/H+ antiporter NhaD/arsenite permease-like protein
MSIALVSVLVLLAVILLSMFSRLNIGLLAIAAAWLIGVYGAGMKPDAVAAGFQASLFVTLVGTTLLFAVAETNRSLEGIATRAFQAVRGNVYVTPLLFFMLGFGFAAVGPGAVASVALVVPLAMSLARRASIPPMLTALMVANGANAGNLSPLSSVGIIANSKMSAVGLGGHEWKVMIANLLAHLFVAAVAYAFFVLRLPKASGNATVIASEPAKNFERSQVLTAIVLGLWVVGVVVFKLPVGLSAIAAAVLLIALRAADEAAAIKQVPWGIILMVTGVSMLIAILESSGGMALFTKLLAYIATPTTVNGVIAFVTGGISTYSSTSGVVLPAFLPTVPGLVQQVGGGDPLAVALSVNVGSSMVDVSPLSTIGALCVAAVTNPAESRKLFYELLVWGLAMAVVAALLCQLFAGAIARW